MIQLDALTPLVVDYGLWVVAAAAVIEGPVVSVLSTALAREGLLPFWPVAAVLLAGDLAGDILHYTLGRRGLAQMPRAWRRWLGIGPARAQQLARHFGRHGGKTLMLAKLTHSIGAPVLLAAGMARMPLAPFLGWNALAALPKTAGLMALGWYAGDAWRLVELWLGRWTWLALAALAAGAVLWWFRNRPVS
ncbi:MAG: hypothetical protein GVY34_11530 [Alphaproteobacteria bacterium]|jgi:membrane protein DedA with SNARE-associated domain|nr:hypothetical protein [Alphaproteobacteria bacterium]